MNDGEAIMQAKQALAGRLIQWRLPDAYTKAGEFIDDMLRHGWKPHPKGLRRPPMKSEECPAHPGEYSDFCRACVSERKAARDAETTGPLLPVPEAIAAVRQAARAAGQPKESA